MLAIDPAAFAGTDAFLSRVSDLAEAIAADEGAQLPGTRRLALRQTAARDGLTLDAATLELVRALTSG